MTARRKWACLAAAGIAAALLIVFILTRRTHRREAEVPSPSDSQLQARKTPHTPGSIPPEAEAQDRRSPSELEERTTGSISGRLVDVEGGAIGNLESTVPFRLLGMGLRRSFEVGRDGSYFVDGLPEGVYSVVTKGVREFRHHGLNYSFQMLPQRVPTGTTDADILVISSNPGAIRGKVLYAHTMQPVTHFTVYQKYDHTSAPERSRQSGLYFEFVRRIGWPAVAWTPFVDRYEEKSERLKEQLESLDPETQKDELDHVTGQYHECREILERYRLDIVSERGVFERSACLLGDYVFTVLAGGCLPKSVEVGLYDSKPVEITFLMHEEGSTVVGKVEDDSGHPVRDASVEILKPTNTEYLYFPTADPEWERVRSVTDERGQFAFENIPDGSYEIRASHTDYAAVAVSSVKVLDHRQEPSSIALRMRRGDAGVWGQIRGSDDSPQARTGVKISSSSCFVTCTTYKDGYYSVAGLAPGDYVMTVNAESLEDRECQFSLLPSQQLRYDVSLAGSATLKGRIVTGKSSHVAKSLPIMLRSEKLVVRNDLRPLGGFSYEFKSLPPGRYELEILSDMHGNVRYSVSLTAGEKRRLDINLRDYGNLTGQVTGRDARPLSGILLKVISSGGEVSTASDPGGHYVVPNLSPGHIQLSIPEGKFAGTWYEFELPKSERKRPSDKVWDIDLSSLGDVSGQILQADGKPLGPAVLRIESPHRSVEVITDREGRFRAEGLFPGRCRIHLPRPTSGRAFHFELAPKEEKEIEIVLPP